MSKALLKHKSEYVEYVEEYQQDQNESIDGGDGGLTFITSPWSTKCLVANDFLYNCHSSHGNKTYWR